MDIHIIAQIYLPEPAGVFASDLAEHWAASGHHVTVWTASGRSGAAPVRPRVISLPGTYDRSSLRGRISSQLGFFGRAAAGLAKWPKQDGPDLFVVVGSPAFPTFLPVLFGRGRSRVVQWVYDLYPEALLALRDPDPFVRTLLQPATIALNFAWREADAVVAISPRMSERIRGRAPSANVQAIPLWAPASVQPSDDRARTLRKARGIEEDAFVVLYHGNLGLAYDFDALFVAARALQDDPRIVFVIVGDGAQRAALGAREGSHANVRIFPPATDAELADSLAMGDCHLVTVRNGWDGLAFPSKFISAIAAGRPVLVVGPHETELAELVRSNECGIAVAPDGAALAAAARRLCDHPQDACAQGKVGRTLYERDFDRARGLERWDALVANLKVDATSPRSRRP